MHTFILAQEEIKVQPAEISTEIYLNGVPQFVEGELQRLYGHIRASLPYIRIFGCAGQISTYVARRGATPVAILLFRLGRRSIVVLNQTFRLHPEELQRFAACAFARFPGVGVIRFSSVQADVSNLAYPVRCGYARENIAIALPASVDDYTASLGKSTRRNLKRYLAKLEQHFPSLRMQSFEKGDIDERLIIELIRLSELRITAKNISFSIDRQYARRIVELAKICGVLDVIWIDGRLCVGMISYRFGADQYAEVIAHDERYNDYSPGMLCYYRAICDSINNGVKTFHMGGGLYDYKSWLLGVQQNMAQVDLYRSRAAMAMNCDWVVRAAIKAQNLRLKTWLRRHDKALAIRFLLASRATVHQWMQGR